MAFQQTVTLVNRTKRNLTVQFDGTMLTIPPGEYSGFPEVAVDHAKAQNPIMGSADPYDPLNYNSLIGVKGKDDCSPIDNDPNEIERVNRGKVRGKYSKKNTERIEAGGVSVFEARMSIAGSESAAEFGRQD